ncbi:MAG TPA: hypothetical protein VFA46_10155 [Actinomycetes bacterium]|jgi:hypothetical protein|nr:hypothetical protein [Actinomycetes bacterium]
MAADATDREERQRRELEEIRRSFTEIGARMGSVFEPAPPDEPEEPEPPEPGPPEPGPAEPAVTPPSPSRQVPSWAMPAVIALVCLLAGGGLGYLLHSPPVPLQATTSTVVTSIVPQAKLVSPPACLETARRGDETIDLLIRNVRDRRLSLALKAYTEASQACRKEASP